MYKEQLALAIKQNGKVLREHGDAVYLPFGSEYSIFIKNLNSVRASVKVTIDGQDVTDGTSLVVEPNSTFDLERFIKNGNFERGNKFRFIERTGAIEDHRGIKIDDGLVRVEWQFAKPLPKVEFEDIHHYKRHHYHYDYDYYWHRPPHWPRPYWSTTYTSNAASSSFSLGDVQYTDTSGSSEVLCNAADVAVNNLSNSLRSASFNTVGIAQSSIQAEASVDVAGITAPGAISEQKFTTVASFALQDQVHSIVIRLMGRVGEAKQKVKKSVTVATRVKCSSCGKSAKSSEKFCARCGTGLQLA